MGSYYDLPHTSRFTPEDDLFLVSWLARHNADGLGRRGNKIYQTLVQQHPTGTDIKPSGWRAHYVQNTDRFDPLIRQYIIDNSDNTGTASYIPPEIQPFTDEEETLLLEYLARHADRKAKSLFGRKMYQRLSDNVGDKWPWGAKHSWYEWRNYYKINSERLDKLIEQYRLDNDIILKNAPRSPLAKQLPTEEDCLLSGFIAEMMAQGAKPSSRLIYRALIKDEEGKWPWGKQRTAEQWRSRYYQKRELLDFLVKQKLAETAHEPDTGIEATTSKSPKLARCKRKSIQQPDNDLSEDSGTDLLDSEPSASSIAGSPMMTETLIAMESTSPRQAVTSLVFAKATSESARAFCPEESTSGMSFSQYSESHPETSDPLGEAATTAVTQLPIYGLFTRQDDTVLLKYMLERSLDDQPGMKKRTGDLFEGIEIFQKLTKTVPAAGRHTAQTWRTRYMKNKMQFDRLVSQLRGPVERARRHTSSQVHISVPRSPHGVKRQIGDSDMSDEVGRPKKIQNSDKEKLNPGKEKQSEKQESCEDGTKLVDVHDEIDIKEEGEVVGYLCGFDGF